MREETYGRRFLFQLTGLMKHTTGKKMDKVDDVAILLPILVDNYAKR